MSYDAIVVGGGHNGLVAAAYLARRGLRTLVLEARDELGGMASTTEIAPGARVPALAHTVGGLWPQVARDLGLRGHGLRLVQPDARVFAPQPDGRALTLWSDAGATAADLRAGRLVSEADADAYPSADELFRSLARTLRPILHRAPADIGSPTLGRRVASLAAVARLDPRLVRAMPMAVRDLVSDSFETDSLRAALAASGMLYTRLGPRMPGSAAALLTAAAHGDAGFAGHAVFARGGPGALSDALGAAVRANGGEIRTATRVARVRSRDWRTVGVTLASGHDIDAPLVVSALDPQTTLLELLEPEVVGPRLSWRAANIRQLGTTAKVNFALRGLPVFPGAYDDSRRLRGRIVIAPSMRYLDLAARPARYAEMADEPLLEITIPSLVDRSLIDSGRAGAVHHVMSVVAQAVPYDADADDVAGAVTRVIDEYAPGFAELVEAREVVTPRDIERDYGACGGHPMHAEVSLDQWFEWRPLHGFGRYRMPLDGFYLCASGAHPGGGVTGAPGRLAATEIFRDIKQARLRVPA